MVRLRNLLPHDSKLRRNRRVLLNIHVSFFAWILEFILGVLGVLVFIFMPFYSSRVVQVLLLALYSIFVPGAYLIQDSDLKSFIVESKFYILFANFIANNYMNQIIPKDPNTQYPRKSNGDIGEKQKNQSLEKE